MNEIKSSSKNIMEWIKKGATLALMVLYLTMATGCSAYKVSAGNLTLNDPGDSQVEDANSVKVKTNTPLVTTTGGKVVLGVVLVAVGIAFLIFIAESFEDSFDKDADKWGPCLGIYC